MLENGLGSLQLVAVRATGAALVYLAIAALRDRRSLTVTRAELPRLLVLGIAGIAMVQWLYFVAIDRLPVSVALLIEFTAPLLVALWVRYVRREDVRTRVWGALGLCLVGLALVAQVWDGLTLDVIGLLAGLGAAAAFATYYLMGEREQSRRDPWSLSAWTFGIAAVFWAVALTVAGEPWWDFPFGDLGDQITVDWQGTPWLTVPLWLLLGWVVLLGTVLPFFLVLQALTRIGPARTGLIGTAEPVVAGAIAWLVLGEHLDAVQLLGGAVVLAGIVLAESARPGAAGPVQVGDSP